METSMGLRVLKQGNPMGQILVYVYSIHYICIVIRICV